ncbi:hypothetical protein [Cohnella lubricantis]|uniref:Uncharacterized protein n=1 Tax=Cohnella lubricantis TaxID=2163172 RepID=A0A841TJ64_9BACL|nr:hypothetical protein [Cohnella lubricantis]MBB6678541.1 hypothetical protein [Cohnella lubricantis]MBP2119150.1 CHASE2 domain-containing sensor protein [Cohnella lubricantis]
MAKFAQVLQSLRNWFESFSWYSLLRTFELHLLFGSLGVMLLREILYQSLPYTSFDTLNVIFHTIPLYTIAYHAFLLGVWLTLVSSNVKYTPYGLWAYAFVYLFPFEGLSLDSLIRPAVYVVLGIFLFRFAASSYARK